MKRLSKFLSLIPSDRYLLVSASLWLGAIRLGLWLLPFQTWWSLLERMTQANTELQEIEQAAVNRVTWAVTVASRYIPGVKCLARALATQVLLNQRGYATCLRLGVAKDEKGQLEAHAWVESQGKIVIGGLGNLSRYTPLPPLEGKRI
jgi:hypothetical protein